MKQELKYANMIAQAREQLEKLTHPLPELPSVGLEDIEKLVSDIKTRLSQPKADGYVDLIKYQYVPKLTSVDLGLLKHIPTPGVDNCTSCQVGVCYVRLYDMRHFNTI